MMYTDQKFEKTSVYFIYIKQMIGQCQGSYYMSDHTISLKVNCVLVVFAFQMYDKALFRP